MNLDDVVAFEGIGYVFPEAKIASVSRRGEYELGRFTVRYAPLRESGFIVEGMWTRYEIYLGEVLIGTQISKPSVSDGDWMLAILSEEKRALLEKRKRTL